MIDENVNLGRCRLGRDLERGKCFQFTVPANCWFASELANKNGFALVGCTVYPAFDFEDFELSDREALLNAFPQHSDLIERLG